MRPGSVLPEGRAPVGEADADQLQLTYHKEPYRCKSLKQVS